MGRVYEGYDGQTNSAIADSVGSHLAEGHGRYSYQDNQRCVKIDRGSLNEPRPWLRLDGDRNLLTQEQSDRLHPLLNER